MAGVAAIHNPCSPGLRRDLSSAKVTTDFLASSHFTIAQDNRNTQPSLKSVFKKDYPPWDIHSKPPSTKPPRPADVLQKDDRYFNEKASETRQAYEFRHLNKPELRNDQSKLSTTNFKMDSDPRLNSFQTTHNRDYTPKQGDAITRGQPKQNPMKSYIPQGDPEKAPEPLSDYRDRYRGHDVSGNMPVKAEKLIQGPTILGDSRQHHFCTTHNETYQGKALAKMYPCLPPVGSNIPQGDLDKEVNMATTHQVSFPTHDLAQLGGYDKNAVQGKLQSTNFNQGDGQNTWNNYRSTMADSYVPVSANLERGRPRLDRNHSDFPDMDDDPYRNAARANMTTNRYYHGNPPPMEMPRIVSGANKRTESKVWFGEPTLAGEFYDTTTDSTFRPVSVPYKFSRPDLTTKSAVPLDYYEDEKNNTTYHSDFLNPKKGKMIPNAIAVETLKESHIRAPLGGERWFATEHLEQYTPKQAARLQVTDPGRLQKSSVPIGTLNDRK